ncbi:hypothetical protein TanjilG_13435 [Lupinus angustifolius]|uniref:Uncharacterized protein n=1 Tax=Lupinus angustifolius TaxID=3871 RepID=A0A4P1RUF0_LUPAN|nr:PREDICTED: uncharacterized protein LOC109342670 [Lupinus angustifolius]OIW18683.1 hypothetical protein TanjilG_13435 [Lupinus angustifolius]
MDLDFENQRDKLLSKNLERESSMGCSSRISYYRSGEGVPFKWEMQPGIAKESAKEEFHPLTPPPGLLSLELPKPCINLHHPKSSAQSRLKFWNKKTKHGKGKKHQENSNEELVGFDMFSRLDCSSDSESIASPRGSSFSWSSSLSIMKGRSSLQSSTNSESPISEVHRRRSLSLGCISINIPRILVSNAKRY